MASIASLNRVPQSTAEPQNGGHYVALRRSESDDFDDTSTYLVQRDLTPASTPADATARLLPDASGQKTSWRTRTRQATAAACAAGVATSLYCGSRLIQAGMRPNRVLEAFNANAGCSDIPVDSCRLPVRILTSYARLHWGQDWHDMSSGCLGRLLAACRESAAPHGVLHGVLTITAACTGAILLGTIVGLATRQAPQESHASQLELTSVPPSNKQRFAQTLTDAEAGRSVLTRSRSV